MNELNLCKISEDELREILEKHEKWLNDDTNGEKANLLWVNLLWVNLREDDLLEADRREADIDFSCLPLWCGSLDITVDKQIAAQLAYHFCRLTCDDEEVKSAQKMLAPLANQFHRVEELGRIEE